MKEKNEIPYEVEEASQKLVLLYFQHWGQKLEDRINALNNVVALAGIKAKFFQEGDTTGWKAETELDGLRAKEFKEALNECWPLGKFEDERNAVARLIMKTKGEQR